MNRQEVYLLIAFVLGFASAIFATVMHNSEAISGFLGTASFISAVIALFGTL